MIPTYTEEQDRAYSVVLHQVAAMLADKRFHHFFKSEAWRFSGDPSLLFGMLRKLFRGQAEQSVSVDATQEAGKAGTPLATMGEATLFTLLASETKQVAEALSKERTIRKHEKEFKVPKGVPVAQAIYALANAANMYAANQWLVVLHRRTGMDAFSNTRNLLCELGKFVEALHTLNVPRGNVKYEAMLKVAIDKGVDYFTQGYPYDVLAHDATDYHALDRKVALTLLRVDYCASHTVMEGQPIPERMEGYQQFAA